MVKYSTETMRSTNDTTGKTMYYQKVCGGFQRVTKCRYNEIFDDSDGVSSMHTKRSHGCTRHYTTHSLYA